MTKKYIDTEKLKAQIQFLIDSGYDNLQGNLYHVLSIIDSLQQEQPEVDLEEYIENEVKHYGLSLYDASYGTFSASQIDRIIRNAFELGLNARKEGQK